MSRNGRDSIHLVARPLAQVHREPAPHGDPAVQGLQDAD